MSARYHALPHRFPWPSVILYERRQAGLNIAYDMVDQQAGRSFAEVVKELEAKGYDLSDCAAQDADGGWSVPDAITLAEALDSAC